MNKNIKKEKELFDTLLKSGKVGIVKFYMNNCPACIAMKEEWSDFVKLSKKNIPDSNIISVERNLLSKFNFPAKKSIMGYPTILEILPGGKKGREFKMIRTTEKLMEFANQVYNENNTSKKGKTKKNRTKHKKGGSLDTAPHSKSMENDSDRSREVNNLQGNNLQENNSQGNNLQENNSQGNNLQENNLKGNNLQENNLKGNNLEENNSTFRGQNSDNSKNKETDDESGIVKNMNKTFLKYFDKLKNIFSKPKSGGTKKYKQNKGKYKAKKNKKYTKRK